MGTRVQMVYGVLLKVASALEGSRCFQWYYSIVCNKHRGWRIVQKEITAAVAALSVARIDGVILGFLSDCVRSHPLARMLWRPVPAAVSRPMHQH